MEKVAPLSETSTRDVREELEQVQMELRAARLSAQTAKEDAAREEVALEAAVAEASIQRDAAVARLAALTEERDQVKRRLEALGPRLDAHREEAEVLARGAARRDHYVDWNPPRPEHEIDARGVAVMVIFLLLVLWMAFAR